MTAALAFAVVAGGILALGAAGPVPARRPAARRSPPPLRSRSWPVQRHADRWLRGRRTRQRDAALPQWLSHLASSVRAGQALGPAIVATAASADERLRPDLVHMAETMRHGASAEEALERWRGDRPSSAVALAASSLALAVRTGGPVAQSVDAVAATLRERLQAQDEARAMGAQARASAWVLIAAPPAFTALVATVDSSLATFLLTTPVGLGCLVGGLTLDAAGAIWMGRITARVGR